MQLQEFSDASASLHPKAEEIFKKIQGNKAKIRFQGQQKITILRYFLQNTAKTNLVTGAVRQKVKQAFLLSDKSPPAARKQHTALT
jgi:hypothetical protein